MKTKITEDMVSIFAEFTAYALPKRARSVRYLGFNGMAHGSIRNAL